MAGARPLRCGWRFKARTLVHGCCEIRRHWHRNAAEAAVAATVAAAVGVAVAAVSAKADTVAGRARRCRCLDVLTESVSPLPPRMGVSPVALPRDEKHPTFLFGVAGCLVAVVGRRWWWAIRAIAQQAKVGVRCSSGSAASEATQASHVWPEPLFLRMGQNVRLHGALPARWNGHALAEGIITDVARRR